MIGQNIKRYRQDADLTQEELATRLGMKKQTISSWEANRTEPTLGQCTKMAEIFGCTVDDLLLLSPTRRRFDVDFTVTTQDEDGKEFTFLIEYMKMPKDKRKMIDEYIKFIANQK